MDSVVDQNIIVSTPGTMADLVSGLSVEAPIYDEAENIEPLHQELTQAMATIGRP